MATKKKQTKKRTKPSAARAPSPVVTHRYCAIRYPKPAPARRGIDPTRARLIRETSLKWMNGSTLRYWFFDTPNKWVGAPAQKAVVRKAFAAWKALGIGLDFVEVSQRTQADIRIAFEQGDGSWSYIGTDVRTKRADPRTMNFGWSLTDDSAEGMDTAIHEIGHTLGFPHEHQNPFAGIVWNEAAVYKALAKPPNSWSRADTFHNIIEKITPDAVQGSAWDPDSVMHYPFEPGLILQPQKYRSGLTPAGGLSTRDREWGLKFYPALTPATNRVLVPYQSTLLPLTPGQQANFVFTPTQTRAYEFRTFGEADTVMVLFDGKQQLVEDDDSGTDRNAYFSVPLKAGRTYTLRVRLYYANASGQTAVMVW